MKTDLAQIAAERLAKDELAPSQTALEQEYTPESLTTSLSINLEEMEVRAGLCSALAQLSTSMRSLLGLMSRHNFVTTLPDAAFPAYERIMDTIGTAATQGSHMVNRSRNLDSTIAMQHMPGENRLPQ